MAAVHGRKVRKRAIIWGIGGHVIKVGLDREIELMRARFVSGIAMNGAALIMISKLRWPGRLRRGCDASRAKENLGMAQETAPRKNEIAKMGKRIHIGSEKQRDNI